MASGALSNPAALPTFLPAPGFVEYHDRAFLRVTGADATRWLNGMVTNAAGALTPGEGNYNFLLNAQGRIQGDCLLYREPGLADEPTFLLATDAAQVAVLQGHLDKYIIMDDVELTPAFPDQTSLLLLAPHFGTDLAPLLHSLDLPRLDPLRLALADTPHGPVLLSTPAAGFVPRVELRAAAATLVSLRQALHTLGTPEISAETLEELRIFEGSPRFGTDIRDRELPQETGQIHALHFSKGCYLGQEIVERIRSRGQVHRTFTAFQLEGALPALPVPLEAEGKAVGELTSAALVPFADGPAPLALGYLRREAAGPQTVLHYAGGTARVRALPRSA